MAPTTRRTLLLLAAASALLIVALGSVFVKTRTISNTAAVRRRLLVDDEETHDAYKSTHPKPIIYTFYHEYNSANNGGTGMSSDADQVLLKIWHGEWQNAGWIPRILTLEDARQHPHFNTLDGMLNGLPFKMYDRLCFLRWLAMANQPGGGFLVDYDTFPLAWSATLLPNGGRLTVHEHTGSGGVPSLVSANQNEWFRFAWALVENAVQHKHETHWSDMKAMQDIYQQSNTEAYILTNNVLPGMAVLHGKGYPEETCDRASRAFAIHFSHHSVDKGILPEGAGSGAQSRAPVAEEWLKMWRKACTVHSAAPLTGGAAAAAAAAAMTPSVGDTSSRQNAEPDLIMREAVAPRGDKPVIFTFYEHANEPDHTGMSAKDDQALIQAWARSWQEVGWEPRVLNIDTARQHPEFATFDGFLEGLPFRKFDRICFYRYLAVGVAGGGWLSDYDTFPLSRANWDGSGDPLFLPNNGDLTVHESSESGGIPSLVSGNVNEWFRLARTQVENAKSHSTEPHWSDMKALQDIYAQSGGTFYKMMENVVLGDGILRKQEIGRDACMWLQTKLAVHFSHLSMHRSGRWKSPQEGAKYRGPVGRRWILDYRQACAVYEKSS